ncbi:MAG TPA: hypothetical protein VFU22_30680 [Roseiflexaceae bacterium]|nr:hypothetical protein [Roseiflexaceae bacterium]
MSVEYCLVRMAPHDFEELRQQPSILHDLMDTFYQAASDKSQDRLYVDSRDVFAGSVLIVPAALRMLYVDEFTTSLLVDFMDERSAVFAALIGWGDAQPLESVQYGHGAISYYAPDDVRIVALKLSAYPHALLEARLRKHADRFRLAAAGYFDGDQAILAHQHTFADLLCAFYDQAARDGDVVLLLVV